MSPDILERFTQMGILFNWVRDHNRCMELKVKGTFIPLVDYQLFSKNRSNSLEDDHRDICTRVIYLAH